MTTLLKQGAKGDQVVSLQGKLAKLGFSVNPDGLFGPATKTAIEDLQSLFGYDVDGIVGQATEQLIDSQIGYAYDANKPDAVKRGLEAQGKKTKDGSLAGAELTRTLKPGTQGADVRYLQRRLNALGFQLAADGIFGPASESAVRSVQQAHGYDADGLAGTATNHLINQQIGLGWRASANV